MRQNDIKIITIKIKTSEPSLKRDEAISFNFEKERYEYSLKNGNKIIAQFARALELNKEDENELIANLFNSFAFNAPDEGDACLIEITIGNKTIEKCFCLEDGLVLESLNSIIGKFIPKSKESIFNKKGE